MLTELSVSNFKSWRCIDKMRLAPITGLFGTNSSGKSSILQLLLMLRQTVESADRAAILEFGGERSLTKLGSFRDIIFGHDLSRSLTFRLCWKLPKLMTIADPNRDQRKLFSGSDLCFETRIRMSESDKSAVQELSYELSDNTSSNRFAMQIEGTSSVKYRLKADAGDFSFTRVRGRAWALPPPIKCYVFPDQTFAYFQNAGFLADLQLALEELFGRLYYLGPLRVFPKRYYGWSGSEPADMGQQGERVVDTLLASRERGRYISSGRGRGRKNKTLEERVAQWLKDLGLIHSFSVKQMSKESKLYEVRVRKSREAAQVLITDVGFGVSQVLPVLALCYYAPEGSTILLEQPELHLHPSVQSGLADVLIDAVRNRKVQIILESHSEHLLRRLQRRIAEKKLAPSDAALYFCDINQGESQLISLELDEFGNIGNWPKDFFGDEFGEMAAMTEAAMERKEVREG
jgi:predicted ATPase